MCMLKAPLTFHQPLTPSQIADFTTGHFFQSLN